MSSRDILNIILPFSLTIIGVVCIIVFVFLFVKPKDQTLTPLKSKDHGCIRSDFFSNTSVVGCDSLGTSYTEYYCEDPTGCRDPDSKEITFKSKIVKSSCQPTCIINQWQLSVNTPCQYISNTDDCVDPGSVPQEKITYTCIAEDLKGIPGCTVTGDRAFLKQFLDQEPVKCLLLEDNSATVQCDTGAIVTITQNCQLENDLPFCGEYLVESKLIKVPDPNAPLQDPNSLTPNQALPDTDPRTSVYKRCTYQDSRLLDLKADCYALDGSGKYTGTDDLFKIGVSREPTVCAGYDQTNRHPDITSAPIIGPNVKCKDPTTFSSPYLPGNLNYTSGESITSNPDCFRTCMYYAPPTDLSVNDVAKFDYIIGRYFVMIVNLTDISNIVRRYMVSYAHSPCRTESYIGQPSIDNFGDCLGKSGTYTDDSIIFALIEIDDVLNNYLTYNVMPPIALKDGSPVDACSAQVLIETNAMIFAGDVNASPSLDSKDIEMLGYNQSKLGFIGGRPFPFPDSSSGYIITPRWYPISSNVSAKILQDPPQPVSSTLYLRFNYLNAIPADINGPERTAYSLQIEDLFEDGVSFKSSFPGNSMLTTPILCLLMSKTGESKYIDISSNNSDVNYIEVYEVGNRTDINGQTVDIQKVIGSRIQRTYENCNLFFKLPVPSDYG